MTWMAVIMNQVSQKIKKNKEEMKPLMFMTDSIVYEGIDDTLGYHGGSIEQFNSMYPKAMINAFMTKDIDLKTFITINHHKRKQLVRAYEDVKMINQLSNNTFKSLKKMEMELYLQVYGYRNMGVYGVLGND